MQVVIGNKCAIYFHYSTKKHQVMRYLYERYSPMQIFTRLLSCLISLFYIFLLISVLFYASLNKPYVIVAANAQ